MASQKENHQKSILSRSLPPARHFGTHITTSSGLDNCFTSSVLGLGVFRHRPAGRLLGGRRLLKGRPGLLLVRCVSICFSNAPTCPRCVSPRFDAFLTCSATGLTCFDTFRRVSTHSLQASLTRPIPAWFLLGGEGEQLVSEEVSIEVMDFWALRLHVNSQSLPSSWLLRNASLFLCSLPRRFP